MVYFRSGRRDAGLVDTLHVTPDVCDALHGSERVMVFLFDFLSFARMEGKKKRLWMLFSLGNVLAIL